MQWLLGRSALAALLFCALALAVPTGPAGAGGEAAAFVAAKIGARVVLREVRWGAFAGRVVAGVTTEDGRDLAALLLAEGLARPYDGGARPGWCG